MSRPSRPRLAVAAAATAAAVCATCTSVPSPDGFAPAQLMADGQRYLDDADFRRRALVEALQNPENEYSRLRLGAYGLGDHGWDLLPVWNPRSETVTAAKGSSAPLSDAMPALWNGERPATLEGWQALGREVFFRYPLRAEPALAGALAAPDRAAAFGIQRTDDGAYPGVLRFADVDGVTRVGIACALCHADVRDGRLVPGAARRAFDLGGLLLWHAGVVGQPIEPTLAARLGRWGAGRADITLDEKEDPVAIPDLWGLRHQTALTQGATLRQTGPVALALRQETQLTESNLQRTRPPRELAWALAVYIYSLMPPARAPSGDAEEVARGRAIFEAGCQHCHENAVGGGPPVRAAIVGTDGALASGGARGTGLYRPPALIDLAHAAPYLHDGAVASLDDLLTPDRLRPDFQRGARGPGPVGGHVYGFRLSPTDRAALKSYLLGR